MERKEEDGAEPCGAVRTCWRKEGSRVRSKVEGQEDQVGVGNGGDSKLKEGVSKGGEEGWAPAPYFFVINSTRDLWGGAGSKPD